MQIERNSLKFFFFKLYEACHVRNENLAVDKYMPFIFHHEVCFASFVVCFTSSFSEFAYSNIFPSGEGP